MDDDEDFLVLRATIGARMHAGQSADGIARVLWSQGYRENAATTLSTEQAAHEETKRKLDEMRKVVGEMEADLKSARRFLKGSRLGSGVLNAMEKVDSALLKAEALR